MPWRSAPCDGREDGDLLAVGHCGVDALLKADVLPGDEHVHKAAQLAVLRHTITEAGVIGLELVDDRRHRAGL